MEPGQRIEITVTRFVLVYRLFRSFGRDQLLGTSKMCASDVKRIHGAEANSLSFLKGYIEKRFRRINPDITTFGRSLRLSQPDRTQAHEFQ